MTRIVVFAKAPVPGFAKTRLVPLLGADGAARLHGQMVARAVEAACSVAPAAVDVSCTPSVDHPLFAGLRDERGVRLVPQGEGDLGARMFRAIESGLAESSAVIIIGTDCPGLDAGYLRAAINALEAGHDVVIGPAEDGGYVLIGATLPEPRIFTGIAWSTASVLARTRAALQACKLSWFELSYLWDVDRPDDFERLRREYPALTAAANRTASDDAIGLAGGDALQEQAT